MKKKQKPNNRYHFYVISKFCLRHPSIHVYGNLS